jgi:hypothetical protein
MGEFAVFFLVVGILLVAFAAGYGVHAWISRRRYKDPYLD